jgi:hypothetical protein
MENTLCCLFSLCQLLNGLVMYGGVLKPAAIAWSVVHSIFQLILPTRYRQAFIEYCLSKSEDAAPPLDVTKGQNFFQCDLLAIFPQKNHIFSGDG